MTATITVFVPATDADVRRGASIPRAPRYDPRWVLRGVQPMDMAEVKAIFHKLHTFLEQYG